MPLTLDELRNERSAKVEQGNKLVDKLDSGEALTADERKEMRSMQVEVNSLAAQIAELEGDDGAAKELRQAREDEAKELAKVQDAARRSKYGSGSPTPDPKDVFRTLGQAFGESESYRGWIQRFPKGAPPTSMTVFQDPFLPDPQQFRQALDLIYPSEKRTMAARANGLVTGAVGGGGSLEQLVRPDWRGLLEPGLVRPLTIRQLVTSIPTGSDAIEYAQEKSRSYGAAPVAEATALTGTSGTKPSSNIDWEVVKDTVHTIAVWIGATKRILADLGTLREMIDQFLLDDLALELEDQIVGGDGSGENFTGILHETGVQTQTADAGGPYFSIRKAKTKLTGANARVQPTAIVMNPADVEQIDLLLVNSEANHFAGPGPLAQNGIPRIWGVPVVESEAVAADTAIMGDFRKALLYVREEPALTVGTVNDDFIRNIVRVLGEERFGFGILRPKAFCTIALT